MKLSTKLFGPAEHNLSGRSNTVCHEHELPGYMSQSVEPN